MADRARPLGVCTGGGIGDVLASMPAINALARHFGRKIAVLTSAYAADILKDHPAVSEILVDDESLPIRDMVIKLARYRFTHAIVFWSSKRVAMLVSQARIGVRVGQSRRLYSWRYTHRVQVRTETGDSNSHWTDVQMDYARALGAQPIQDDFRTIMNVGSDDLAQADLALAESSVSERFVVLHAARGIPLDGVRWPVERFAAIGDALSEAFGTTVVLTGDAADVRRTSEISALMRKPSAMLAGSTSLRCLTGLLAKAQVVVALDSGPMHIAAAAGTPTVGIFALRTDLPNRWKPLGPRVALIEPSYPCPRWHRKENCPDFACYAALQPEIIVALARNVARRNAAMAVQPSR